MRTFRIYSTLKVTLSLLAATLLSADILCKQFGPRSGTTEYRSRSGSKTFDTLMVLLKNLKKKKNNLKSQQTTYKKFNMHTPVGLIFGLLPALKALTFCFDSLHSSQQFFSHVGMGLPGLNQY